MFAYLNEVMDYRWPGQWKYDVFFRWKYDCDDLRKLRNRAVISPVYHECNGVVMSARQTVTVNRDVAHDSNKWEGDGAPCVYLVICENHWGHPRPEVS